MNQLRKIPSNFATIWVERQNLQNRGIDHEKNSKKENMDCGSDISGGMSSGFVCTYQIQL